MVSTNNDGCLYNNNFNYLCYHVHHEKIVPSYCLTLQNIQRIYLKIIYYVYIIYTGYIIHEIVT